MRPAVPGTQVGASPFLGTGSHQVGSRKMKKSVEVELRFEP